MARTKSILILKPPLRHRVLEFIIKLNRPVTTIDVALGPCRAIPIELAVATGRTTGLAKRAAKRGKPYSIQRLAEVGRRQHAAEVLSKLYNQDKLIRVSKATYALPLLQIHVPPQAV